MHSIRRAFPRSARLLLSADYSRVFAQAWKSGDGCFTVLGRYNGGREARLGLAIAKKNLRLAVERNRVKRIIRESFRHNQDLLEGLDIVVLVKPTIRNRSNDTLFQSLDTHWRVLVKRMETGRAANQNHSPNSQ